MSDDEMMYEEDNYDEYEEEDGDGEGSGAESEGVEIENQYYNAKSMHHCFGHHNHNILFLALIEDSIPDAIKAYEKVVDLEGGEKGEWYKFLYIHIYIFLLYLLNCMFNSCCIFLYSFVTVHAGDSRH